MQPENAIEAIVAAQMQALPDTQHSPDVLERALDDVEPRDYAFTVEDITRHGVQLPDAYGALLELYDARHLETIPGFGGSPQQYFLTREGILALNATR